MSTSDSQQSLATMEYSALREEGIALIQRLAGATWTDHNTHDPGITILEQVCYALTDLGYRTRYAVPDLLTRAGEDAYSSLYTPTAILPSAPVTITDLRKLVLDVPGVKNAWIEPVDEVFAVYDAAKAEVSYPTQSSAGPGAASPSPNVSEIRPKGLYRVRIEKSDLSDIAGGDIRREAARRLHRFRALGEDYVSIEVLEYQLVQFDVALEIAPVADATDLLAAIYRSMTAYCSPSVPFHTLTEMLQRGARVDEILEGPLLDHGFVDSRELAQVDRRGSLRISDLIHELAAVPGVLAVKSVHFLGSNGQTSKDWLLTLDTARTPRVDLQASSIRLERRGLRVDSPTLASAAYRRFIDQERQTARPIQLDDLERELRPAPGRDRNVGRYRSVQEQFPELYGIGSVGLADTASPRRRAQARQLKAYLMFYDQILANYFAQLANVGRLFSFQDETLDSYFSQAVQDSEGALGLDAIRESGPEHEGFLQRITENPWGAGESADLPDGRRRNRLLDHLLARLGEQFTDYSLLQSGAAVPDTVSVAERLAGDKRAFLRDYPRIGHDRGIGFDCLAPASDGSSDVLPGDCIDPAGLTRKLTAAVPDALSQFLLAQCLPDETYTLTNPSSDRAALAATLAGLLDRIIHGASSLYAADRFAGVSLSQETGGLLQQDPPPVGADRVRLNRLLLEDAYPAEISRSRAEDNVSGLELALRRKLGIRLPEEALHVVEHILLRPIDGDTNQTGPLFRAAALQDSYSLQISVVFPSWPLRYQDPSFMQFAEQTVREQTPAHLTTHVLWLGRAEMAAFEVAYADWVHRWRNQRLADLGL